ncbi:unnamed protein product [Ectocarpus sp. 4 AP-2014]
MLESMPWEVLWQVFCSPGISSRELFGPIRGVCGNWMRAVDAMPCAAARREVAKVCAGEPTETEDGGREQEDEGGGKGGEPSEASPSAEQEDDDGDGDGGVTDEGGAAVSAMATGDDDGGGGGQAGQGNVGGASKRQRRMRLHLDAVKVLCEEWGLLGAGGACAAASSGGGASSGSGNGGGVGSWSGWEAFGLAIATSASRDRLSLCCWAVRPLMGEDAADSSSGGVDGGGEVRGRHRQAPSCPGLPRGEVIEILCLMLCALRSLEGSGGGGGGGGGDEPMAQADGSTRLKADLLVCARVLENWDVRFQKPGHPGGGGGGGGGASGLISNLTAEQRSIVLADVKPGGVLTVLAFAGTGKTTCLRAYAQARPHLKILYLTFNVSVREEAEKTFPPHVACKGVHQLAFRFVGRRFQSKLKPDLRESDVQAFLKDRLGKDKKINLATAARVLATLNAFFSSDCPALSASHVIAPPPEVLFQQQQQQQQQRRQQQRQEQLDHGPGSADEGDGEDSGSDDDSDDDVGESKLSRQSPQPAAAAPSSSSPPAAACAQGGASTQLPHPGPARKRRRRAPSPVEDATVLEWAAMAWTEMQSTGPPGGAGWGGGDGEGAAAASLGMTHAGYLKLFQLSRPCLGRTYDVIMLDEAQDSNPCIASIVLRETRCARILVGDSHQAIYGFIGAEDHLKRVEGGKIRHLTQVFRFDQSIAHVANSLVGPLKGETRPLLGCAGKQGKVVLAGVTGLEVWQDQERTVKRPIAFLARTVSTLVHAAMWARSRGEKVAWVGGAQAYSLEAIEDMCLMAMGRSEEVKHALLKKLKTIKKLVRFIQESGDRQWANRLRMLDGKDPQALLSELREIQRKQVHPREADTLLSTVHKAKGLEFNTVVLADDFIEVDDIRWTTEPCPQPMWDSEADKEEVNILYVAVTRAKRRLVVNSSLRAFLLVTGAWNSVSLRGVAGRRTPGEGSSSSPPVDEARSSSSHCNLCGRRADAGGGGNRVDLLSRAQAADAQQLATSGRAFANTLITANQRAGGGGLLYAESGSLRPLCCCCVEGVGGGRASAPFAAGAAEVNPGNDAAVGTEDDNAGAFYPHSQLSRCAGACAVRCGIGVRGPHLLSVWCRGSVHRLLKTTPDSSQKTSVDQQMAFRKRNETF